MVDEEINIVVSTHVSTPEECGNYYDPLSSCPFCGEDLAGSGGIQVNDSGPACAACVCDNGHRFVVVYGFDGLPDMDEVEKRYDLEIGEYIDSSEPENFCPLCGDKIADFRGGEDSFFFYYFLTCERGHNTFVTTPIKS